MKVHEVASADIQSGKGQEAWAWAIKSAEYVDKNNPGGVQTDVVQNVTGSGNRVIWVSVHDSLGDAETFREWMEADEGFQNILAESEGLMDWSTFDRQYYRVRN
jgi:hypothetical protein